MYREAPPITRTWITGSVFLSVLVAARRVDLRAIGFSERDVLEHGEWWRLLVNFFYMGDQVLSIFYWLQLYHFAECLKVLELVKYRWEPADFVKTILVNAAFLLVLKQFSKSMIFLGSPMVMVFVYLYARTCACAAAAPHAFRPALARTSARALRRASCRRRYGTGCVALWLLPDSLRLAPRRADVPGPLQAAT